MKNKSWRPYLFFVLLTLGTGALAGLLTGDATQIYNETIIKPKLSPPTVLFPIVWSILYALMGISAARIWNSPESKERTKGLNLFIVQLIVNFFWSLIFFNAQAFGFALLWIILLWVLILWMIFTFYKTDKIAALLQLPYLLWVSFAGWLNYMVWMLNR